MPYSQPRTRRRRKRKHIPHARRPVHFVENRNRRERQRVKTLNDAFENLKKRVPYCESGDHFSKVDILLAATDYICGLQEMIEEYDTRWSNSTGDGTKHSMYNNSLCPTQGQTRRVLGEIKATGNQVSFPDY